MPHSVRVGICLHIIIPRFLFLIKIDHFNSNKLVIRISKLNHLNISKPVIQTFKLNHFNINKPVIQTFKLKIVLSIRIVNRIFLIRINGQLVELSISLPTTRPWFERNNVQWIIDSTMDWTIALMELYRCWWRDRRFESTGFVQTLDYVLSPRNSIVVIIL